MTDEQNQQYPQPTVQEAPATLGEPTQSSSGPTQLQAPSGFEASGYAPGVAASGSSATFAATAPEFGLTGKQEAGGAAAGESSIAASGASGSTPTPTTGDAPSAPSENPTFTNTVNPALGSSVITDTTLATNDATLADVGGISMSEVTHDLADGGLVARIREGMANIREHLNVRHFEQEVVSAIHAEIEAIERLL